MARLSSRTVFLVSSLGMALVVAPGFAAEQDRAEAKKTVAELPEEEIIITATKAARSLEDIPASVAVIDRDALAGAGGYDGAEQLTRLLSGVQSAIANGSQVAWQIRGIGAVDHQALTPGAAAVYLDGVFLATNVQTGPMLYDMARVEVLKGPQGALYGRNASSGAIDFQTARPASGQQSHARASYGSFDRVDFEGAIGHSLSDRLHVRLAGRRLVEGAKLENVVTDDTVPGGPAAAGGARDEVGLRASLVWQPGAAEIFWRTHYEEDNGVNPAPRNDATGLDDHRISVGPDGVQDTENQFYGTALEVRYPVGAWALFSLSALEGYAQEYGFDFDGTQAPFSTPSLNANLSYDRDYLQASQEVRGVRNWQAGRSLIGVALAVDRFAQDYLIWCGDLDAERLTGTCPYVGAAGRVGPAPAADGTAMSLLTYIEQERTSAAVFTHNEIDLGDRLTLTLGARYSHERLDGQGYGLHVFDDGTQGYNNRDGLGPATGGNEIEEGRVSGTLGLSYRLSADDMVWASLANGYKGGGFNGEIQNNAAHFDDEGLFDAETVTALEAGWRGSRGAALSLSATAFYQDYQAPQARIFVTFPLPDGGSIVSNSLSNLDEAVSYGLEAEADWIPFAGMEVTGGVTLLQTEISQETDIGGNAALFDGNRLPFAAPVSARLGARYERSAGQGRRFALSGNISHKGAYYLDAEGLEARRENGYTLVDGEANLYLDGPGLALSLWARNLANEDHAVSGYGFIGYNTFRSSPRQYGVSVKAVF